MILLCVVSSACKQYFRAGFQGGPHLYFCRIYRSLKFKSLNSITYGQLKTMNSKINRTGAFSLYEEVYLKTLNNIENLLNTDKDNTLAKFLVKETKHLNHKKIINFVRETEVSFNKTKVYSLCCVGRSLLYELGHII